MTVLKGMFQKTSKSVCASTVGVPPDHLFPFSSITSGMKYPGNKEEDPDCPDPAVSKKDLRSVWVPSDKLDK